MPTDSPREIRTSDADALKKQFKARCAETDNVFQNWQIRIHRSISWLKRAGEFGDQQPEAKFLLLWIALNSIYARWDNKRNVPDIDGSARRDFLRKVCEMDLQVLESFLREHRGLVKKLLSDPFLSSTFWANPDHPDARRLASDELYHLDGNLKSPRGLAKVLEQLTSRMFVLRGQIVHGASSGGSRLNRAQLKYCLQLLALLVPVVLQITIDHGCNNDWPELCYPPIK